jgi:hypothetical protein
MPYLNAAGTPARSTTFCRLGPGAAKAQRDPALMQHVLLGQGEAEVSRRRQGLDHLSQSHAHRRP